MASYKLPDTVLGANRVPIDYQSGLDSLIRSYIPHLYGGRVSSRGQRAHCMGKGAKERASIHERKSRSAIPAFTYQLGHPVQRIWFP